MVFGADVTAGEEGKRAEALVGPTRFPHISMRLAVGGRLMHTFSVVVSILAILTPRNRRTPRSRRKSSSRPSTTCF